MTTVSTAALLLAAYGLSTLVPNRGRRRRHAGLALAPAVAALWTFGIDASPGLLATAIAGAVAGMGHLAYGRIERAGLWIAAQVVVIGVLAALPIWIAPVARAVPAEVAVLAILAIGLVVTIEWGGVFVGCAIRPFADRMTPNVAHEEGVVRPPALPKGFVDGGKMIGRLERLLIFLFVLTAAPTAIGFLVTAKSILRFGEIKDHDSQKEAEYIIIGTLMSFGFALISSYLTRLALLAILPEAAESALSLGGGG